MARATPHLLRSAGPAVVAPVIRREVELIPPDVAIACGLWRADRALAAGRGLGAVQMAQALCETRRRTTAAPDDRWPAASSCIARGRRPGSCLTGGRVPYPRRPGVLLSCTAASRLSPDGPRGWVSAQSRMGFLRNSSRVIPGPCAACHGNRPWMAHGIRVASGSTQKRRAPAHKCGGPPFISESCGREWPVETSRPLLPRKFRPAMRPRWERQLIE